VVAFDLKLPQIFWLWPFVNILLVVIPEEVFFRGFVQQEIYKAMGGKGILANVGCVTISALIFTLFHVGWVGSCAFLSLVFLSGLIYGGIYQYTKAIESSIFCHFALNLVHFFFFTYPVLQTA
jgi:membrane protease YdiL (CAAX protease family)